MTIREKILAIQLELKAPKGQFNKFGNYNYRSCEDILEALKPLLEKHKAVVTVSDRIVKIGERYYVKSEVRLNDLESENYFFVTAYAREELDKKGMDGSQITGASSSYARKYALNGLFGIDDAKDSDSTNKHDAKTSPKPLKQTDDGLVRESTTGECSVDHTTLKVMTVSKEGPNNGKQFTSCPKCGKFNWITPKANEIIH